MLVPLDKLAAHGSDMTPLHTLPLKCAACGGREVELWLFVKRDEAEAWVVLRSWSIRPCANNRDGNKSVLTHIAELVPVSVIVTHGPIDT